MVLLAADREIRDGGYSLLFSAPEAIVCDRWRQMLIEAPLCNQVVTIAIDEAHCVSQWLVTVHIDVGCRIVYKYFCTCPGAQTFDQAFHPSMSSELYSLWVLL
jgi:hypothetical protein